MQIREEPLMIWGWLGQKQEKKIQRLLAWEKKLNSTAPKKKTQQSVGREEKIQHELSARAPPPDH